MTLTRPASRLVATAAAAAMAFGTAAPAQAASDWGQGPNAMTLILGLAAIGIVAHELDKDRKDDDDDRKDDRYDPPRGGYHSGYGYPPGYWGQPSRGQPPRGGHGYQQPQKVSSAKLIPERCVVEARTNGGWTGFVSEDCFRSARGSRLPDSCETEVRTSRGRQSVHSMSCLSGRGYRIVER